MGMNIGIITAEGYEYPPTKRLLEAAAQKGHRLIVIDPLQLWPILEGGRPGSVGPHISLMGIPMVNDLDAIRLTKDQFLTLQALSAAQLPIPDTGFINSHEGFQAVLARLGGYPIVVKQVSGRVGEGVFLVNTEHKARLILHLKLEPGKGMLVQKFIPPENRQDIRVLVIGGQVAGAMKLKPKKGDFRANFHLSKQSWPVDLPSEWEEIALRAADTLGLEIAGVDLIVDQHGEVSVIEVNYTPGFSGLEAATGLDIAGRIIDYLAETYGKRNL